MPNEKSCGCKGIRTCLLCEEQSNSSIKTWKTEEIQYVYDYCYHCNLCWPNDEVTSSLCDFPLYLGKIKLVPEFYSKEEESAVISFIDKIPWMKSQSGRRKQDFGPKVNFKKKKVKIGEFKGFPKFTETTVKKLQTIPELSDFDPVELCNLEYTPERGSSIDPHVDDFWLWGERLVTVNLNSTTVLTLVPCSNIACKCLLEANMNSFQPNEKHDETNLCKHLFKNDSPIKHSLKCLSKNDIENKLSNPSSGPLTDELSNITIEDEFSSFSLKADNNINSVCNLFQTCLSSCKICVRIVLPPRSLFVLSGCARYNWFHEIRRQDIVSRRLAMTFRELSTEFLNEDGDKHCGNDLLLIAKKFYNL